MARQSLVSLLLIAAALAAVGLVTSAIYSDQAASSSPVGMFSASSVEVTVDGYDQFFETLLDLPNMAPGDCSYDQVTVNNPTAMPLNIWNWIYVWGDLADCDPGPSCNFNVSKTLLDDSDSVPDHLEVGGYETYDLAACLPLCAGNGCQRKSATMRMFFHAVQEENLEGYECVKLEDKEAPEWIPDPTTSPHGNLCYKVVDDQNADLVQDFDVVIDAYGLDAGTCYQLDLSGGDTDDGYDPGCEWQDGALSGMSGSGDIYVSGYWNWGTYLESDCDADHGGEGVWNFAGVYEIDAVCSDASGYLGWSGTLTGLPAGSYHVKHNIKEIDNPWPGDGWTGVLSGLDYLQFTLQ